MGEVCGSEEMQRGRRTDKNLLISITVKKVSPDRKCRQLEKCAVKNTIYVQGIVSLRGRKHLKNKIKLKNLNDQN